VARLAASVAAVRAAVREALVREALVREALVRETPAPEAGVDERAGGEPPLALVACSGGPDSLALAAGVAFVAPRLGWRGGLLTVDHGLQPGSRQRAEQVAGWGRAAGLSPVEVLPVSVAGRPGGPEAAARAARYQALAAAAERLGATVVLLGHTRDDQAETVLLALARGAGPRGLAGMPSRRAGDNVAWLRPLLGVSRAQTHQACAELKLDHWDDPHNADPAFARARVRTRALPALVEALGDRVVDNLARTAEQAAADNAALDALARQALAAARTGDDLVVARLRDLPPAIRTRALHAWARELGVSGSALSHRHVAALDALITAWRGQGPTHLPGGLTVARRGGTLVASDRSLSR
jgi:tRNA(Ile)-lysidine synthase